MEKLQNCSTAQIQKLEGNRLVIEYPQTVNFIKFSAKNKLSSAGAQMKWRCLDLWFKLDAIFLHTRALVIFKSVVCPRQHAPSEPTETFDFAEPCSASLASGKDFSLPCRASTQYWLGILKFVCHLQESVLHSNGPPEVLLELFVPLEGLVLPHPNWDVVDILRPRRHR